MDWFSKILLSPFALLYGLAISMRNALYDSQLLKATAFNIPVISVGNISVGGTGKTPTVEWLIERLSPFLQLSILSRGYSRKTKGYRKVSGSERAKDTGDEPLQIKRKYPFTNVAVSESRTLGLTSMLMDYPNTQAVLLDDAFQHRSIAPGLSILLTEYDNPYFEDYLMPVGRLREWRSAASRADILIVTKCPQELTNKEVDFFRNRISEVDDKNIYFSQLSYGACYLYTNYTKRLNTEEMDAVLIVAGIATPQYLIDYMESRINRVYQFLFADHHTYDKDDILNIINAFKRIPGTEKKCIVTTEKDIVKLVEYRPQFIQHGINLLVQRVGVDILHAQELELTNKVKHFLLNFAS